MGFLGLGGAPGVNAMGGINGAIGGTSVNGAPLVFPSALGNIFSAGHIVPFAAGGVVDGPSVAPMALFGEAGPEAIMPLRRGPDGKLGVAAGAGGGLNVNVNVHNAPAGVQSQTSRADSNGNVSVDVVLKRAVDDMVAESIANGSGRRVLARQFGVKPFVGQ
jgi:phage-related minor tail protein